MVKALEHPLVQFFVMIIALMAGFIIVKTATGALIKSDQGWLAAFKKIVLSA